MTTIVINPVSQKRSAQIFNAGSVIAMLCMPLFPIFFVWIGISIFVYSANIQHPNVKVRKYTQYAGYRFYGISGALLASMIFAGILIPLAGGSLHLLLLLWSIGIIVVVPAGVYSMLKAKRENWQDFKCNLSE